MATESVLSHFPENGSSCESGQPETDKMPDNSENTASSLLRKIALLKQPSELLPLALRESVSCKNNPVSTDNNPTEKRTQPEADKMPDNSENTVVSLVEGILSTKQSPEDLPLALCENVSHETDPASGDSNPTAKTTKIWYLQDCTTGVYAINNYLYIREKTWRNSRGQTILYLKCTKYGPMNCRNGKAVLLIDENGTKKIRNCCEDSDHSHPPPYADVVKRNFKLKLKALTERFPEKTTTDVYRQIVREETLAYSEIDPSLSKFIPKFHTVRTFLHQERLRVRQERGGFQIRKRTKRKITPYETVEVNGTERSDEYLPIITSTRRLKKKIKEEVISSSDENSCAGDDPGEAEVSEGASDRESGLDSSAPKPPATNNNSSLIQQFPEQNIVRFESPAASGVFQTNNDCSLPTIVSVSDQNSYTMTTTSQSFCDQSNFQNRFDHLAKNWSEKLKILRNDQRIYAEKLINDVLYEAELCLLNHGCQIYNASR